jgi:hypothetical protein
MITPGEAPFFVMPEVLVGHPLCLKTWIPDYNLGNDERGMQVFMQC